MNEVSFFLIVCEGKSSGISREVKSRHATQIEFPTITPEDSMCIFFIHAIDMKSRHISYLDYIPSTISHMDLCSLSPFFPGTYLFIFTSNIHTHSQNHTVPHGSRTSDPSSL